MSGGALLGDRVRMEGVALDSGVFIRSMATRGSSGGIAIATCEVADLMDAFGFERVVIETVGVGQAELDIAQGVDTTVVVLVPESGDSIQTLKAGLMEIADVFVVNKADRPGAERLRQDIEVALSLTRGQGYRQVGLHNPGGGWGVGRRGNPPWLPDSASGASPAEEWEPPVLATVATRERGLGGANALIEALDRHYDYLERSGMLAARRRSSLATRTRAVVDRALSRWYRSRAQASLADLLEEVAAGAADPYQVAARIVGQLEEGRAT
jgi:LAO/AO transport system kinase